MFGIKDASFSGLAKILPTQNHFSIQPNAKSRVTTVGSWLFSLYFPCVNLIICPFVEFIIIRNVPPSIFFGSVPFKTQ
jgi:hypothetical protein